MYTNWHQGEPNNFGEEHCTLTEADNAGGWNHLACTEARAFVCDIRAFLDRMVWVHSCAVSRIRT